jgi:hypothetical protein
VADRTPRKRPRKRGVSFVDRLRSAARDPLIPLGAAALVTLTVCLLTALVVLMLVAGEVRIDIRDVLVLVGR